METSTTLLAGGGGAKAIWGFFLLKIHPNVAVKFPLVPKWHWALQMMMKDQDDEDRGLSSRGGIVSNHRNKDRLFGDASIYLPMPTFPRPWEFLLSS